MKPEEIRERLRKHRPNVQRFEGKIVGEVFFQKLAAGPAYQLGLLQREAATKDRRIPTWCVVALTLCTEDGELVYPDFDEGCRELARLEPDAQNELANFALEVTGLKVTAIEDAEKKSSATPTSDSLTASSPLE